MTLEVCSVAEETDCDTDWYIWYTVPVPDLICTLESDTMDDICQVCAIINSFNANWTGHLVLFSFVHK